MTTCALLLASAATMAAANDLGQILEPGGDPAAGILFNATPGARPFDPPGPSRPTLVVVHGINPVPHVVHWTIAQRLGEAVEIRRGPALNVLGWDWNGSTLIGLNPRGNDEHAVVQGRRLCKALLDQGLRPGQLHLIGQSSGAVVVASAARSLLAATGQSVAQVTLLDPAVAYHELIFKRLTVGSCGGRVEHYWVPGPTGLSREVTIPGVADRRVDLTGAWRGSIRPSHWAHMNVMRWYIETVARPSTGEGFNASVFAKGG